jgi:hypothetical protein
MLRNVFKVEPIVKPATDRLASNDNRVEKSSLPEHLTSPEKFREYLTQFENEDRDYCIKKVSYRLGNYINAQAYQIQAAGKNLLIHADPDQIPVLMENLSSRGLYLITFADSKEEADRIVSDVARMTHD